MRTGLTNDQPQVTVDLLIMTVSGERLRLLLSQRVNPPFTGQWALPGRFIGLNESAEEAAGRLLEEMLPVRNAFLEQLYTFTRADRDPRGRVISVAYLLIVSGRKLRTLLAEGKTPLRCFEVALDEEGLRLADETGLALSGEDLAFDHGRIVETGIRRLRGKIDYTDIGFRFLENPDEFSLGELQIIYEAVQGTMLDSSNFRRFILNRYEKDGRLSQTDQMEKRGRGRPAALYRFNGWRS